MRTLRLTDHLIAASLVTVIVAVLMAMAQWNAEDLAREALVVAPTQEMADQSLGDKATDITRTILRNVGLYGLFFFLVGIGSAVALERRGHHSRRAYLALGAVWGLVFLVAAFGFTTLRICLSTECQVGGLRAVLLSPAMYLFIGLMAVAFAVLAYLYRTFAYRKL